MKILSFLLLILLSYKVNAQKSIFVRVYDLTGKKINKGHVITATDTSLQLEGKSTPVDIPVRRIGFIKTKHSMGNNLLIGSVIGATTLAILGVATAEPDKEIMGYTEGEGAAAGALIGLPIGVAIGRITIAFKNSKTYSINGDIPKWNAFQSLIIERDE